MGVFVSKCCAYMFSQSYRMLKRDQQRYNERIAEMLSRKAARDKTATPTESKTSGEQFLLTDISHFKCEYFSKTTTASVFQCDMFLVLISYECAFVVLAAKATETAAFHFTYSTYVSNLNGSNP